MRKSEKGVVLATTVVFMMIVVALSVLVIALASIGASVAVKAEKLASSAISADDIGGRFVAEVRKNQSQADISAHMNAYIEGSDFSAIVSVSDGVYTLNLLKDGTRAATVSVKVTTENETSTYTVTRWEYEGKGKTPQSGDTLLLRNAFIRAVYGDKDTAITENTLGYISLAFTTEARSDGFASGNSYGDVLSLTKSGVTYYFTVTEKAGEYSFTLIVKDAVTENALSGSMLLDATVYKDTDGKIYIVTSDGKTTEILYDGGNLYMNGELVGDTYQTGETSAETSAAETASAAETSTVAGS